MFQALRLRLKKGPEDMIQPEFFPYAIWHNQKTKQVTFRTNTGEVRRIDVEQIETIEFVQDGLSFDEAPSEAV